MYIWFIFVHDVYNFFFEEKKYINNEMIMDDNDMRIVNKFLLYLIDLLFVVVVVWLKCFIISIDKKVQEV